MDPQSSVPEEVAGDVVSIVLPGSGSVVTRLFTAVRNEWNRNRSKALKAAEKKSGLTREDIAERIENNPELVPIVTRLLWEAAMSGQSPLLEAMGATFGAAVAEPSRAGDYEMILGGLRNLRGHDVQILREIRDRHVFYQQSDEHEVQETMELQTVRRLGSRLQLPDETVAFGLVRLVNQGFATSVTVFSGTRFPVRDD